MSDSVSQSGFVPRRDGGYARGGTIPRPVLLRQGWTPADIARLLGDPDWADAGFGIVAYRWAAERVDAGLAADPGVRNRVEHRRHADAVDARRRVEEDRAGVQVVWRLLDGEWLEEGPDLIPGQVVVMVRKDRTTSRRRVLRVVAMAQDGTCLAEMSDHEVRQAPNCPWRG